MLGCLGYSLIPPRRDPPCLGYPSAGGLMSEDHSFETLAINTSRRRENSSKRQSRRQEMQDCRAGETLGPLPSKLVFS